MTTQEKVHYYNSTQNSAVRDDLRFAVTCVARPRVAIDCGCGAGADIAYLRSSGFTVHAFDIEAEAIRRCMERFQHDAQVHLTQTGFADFKYPQADLVVADASLFFCKPEDFEFVWQNIITALASGGVFSGSFLGCRDTMASASYNKAAYWPDVLVLDEARIRECFSGFDILRLDEHEVCGTTANNEAHHWHLFTVVAKKR